MERSILSLPFRYRQEKLKIVKNKNYEIENIIICANIISFLWSCDKKKFQCSLAMMQEFISRD